MTSRRYVVLLPLMGVAGGCGRRVQAPPAEPIAGQIAPKSERLDVDIVYDATPSMRGFTAAGDSALCACNPQVRNRSE
jgi:hypothetical protein